MSRLRYGNEGQSLVEFALAVPVLLLLLLGLADFGRAFYFTTTIANSARTAAAHDAAAFSAGDAGTACSPCGTSSAVYQSACNETGFASTYGGSCGADFAVDASTQIDCAGVTGPYATVTVTYTLHLISSYVVGRLVPSDNIPLRACATYPITK